MGGRRPPPGPARRRPAAAAPRPITDAALTTQAPALVQHFHQRLHGTADVAPSAKALTPARTLMARAAYAQAQERAARLAQLRATTPPDVLAAIEEAAAAHFERDNTNPFGRDTLRRYAVDAAVAAHFQLPAFAEWQAAQGRG